MVRASRALHAKARRATVSVRCTIGSALRRLERASRALHAGAHRTTFSLRRTIGPARRLPVRSSRALHARAYRATLPPRARRGEARASAHREAPPPPLRRAIPGAGYSLELELLVQKAMAKLPEDRFQSAVEMAAALEALPEARGGTAAAKPAAPPRPPPGRPVDATTIDGKR